jgi:hypothetical protein
MTGSWQFSATSTPYGIVSTGTGSLQQSGSSLSGQLSLSGTPCATSASLTGSVSGTSLSFEILEGSQPIQFTGTANASLSSASGTYTAAPGGCADSDYGTWAAVKQ